MVVAANIDIAQTKREGHRRREKEGVDSGESKRKG
jgi:hypothetical protein